MAKLFSRFFSTQYMVKPELRQGELTSTGEAYETLFRIAFPAIIEMVSLAVISMADTAMVSRLGSYAVASVGLTTQPRMIFMSIFLALNIAVTAIVARRKGQNDRESARLCLRQALIVEVGLILVMSTLQVLLAGWIMRLAGANGATLAASTEYATIMGAGLVFPALSTLICSAQRGVGRTKITLAVNLTANIVNVIFNYLLIGGNLGFPRLEVGGAAIATVIGNGVGLVLAIISLIGKESYLCLSFKESWRPNQAMLKNIFHLTSGALTEQIAVRIGFFWFASVVASLGTDQFASHQIALQLLNLSFTFGDGIAVATTALVGQNLGKGRPDLSILYGKVGQRFAFVIAVILCAASITGRYFFASLFSDQAHIISASASVIIILGIVQPIQASHIVMAGSLRGAGDTKYVAFTMLITVMTRAILSSVAIYGFHTGLIGAWCVILFDQILRLIMLFSRFTKGKWTSIAV